MTEALVLNFPRPEVAVMTLNRPDRLNALTTELVAAITSTLHKLSARREIRAIIITGAGRGFCAGLDLLQPGDGEPGGGIPKAYEGQERFSGMIEAV